MTAKQNKQERFAKMMDDLTETLFGKKSQDARQMRAANRRVDKRKRKQFRENVIR